MPTTPNGCIDICAIITPQTTTTQRTRASMLAKRITSGWTLSQSTSRPEHEQATSEMLALLEELQVRSKAAATSPVMLFFGNDKVKPPNEKRTRTLTSQLEATHPTL